MKLCYTLKSGFWVGSSSKRNAVTKQFSRAIAEHWKQSNQHAKEQHFRHDLTGTMENLLTFNFPHQCQD